MSVTAIVGINWGDEGKGRMVDYLSESYDVVVRYQGGNNAGHTVINEFGKFALNLLPSGIFRPGTINILGPGTVINPEHLCGEIEKLHKVGMPISPENLCISDRAMICMPFHAMQDQLEEDRLGNAEIWLHPPRHFSRIWRQGYEKNLADGRFVLSGFHERTPVPLGGLEKCPAWQRVSLRSDFR